MHLKEEYLLNIFIIKNSKMLFLLMNFKLNIQTLFYTN